MTTESEDREQGILEMAEIMMAAPDQTDDADIDATFLFFFEVGAVRWVSRIRAAMRSVLHLPGHAPLAVQDGVRWQIHLEHNPGVQVSVTLGADSPRFNITTRRGGYRPLNEWLRRALDLSAPSGDPAKIQRVWMRLWIEASRTAMIQAELERFAHAYGLLPSPTDVSRYASDDVKRKWEDVLGWVMWQSLAPSFLWQKVRFLESKTEAGIRRTLRPYQVTVAKDPSMGTKTWGLRRTTRARTWAIYLLSRRGGGRLSEDRAIDLWNQRFTTDPVEEQNYESQRKQLIDWRRPKNP